MERRAPTRASARMSWTCAILLVLMSSVQAAHVCGLEEGALLQPGATAQVRTARSADVFCVICASSHSPSLAAPVVCLPSADSVTEPPLHRLLIGTSVSQQFALYIRPPPLTFPL